MNASEIIDKILKDNNLNAKSFSERLGLERPQAIYDIQKGKTKSISTQMADKITSVFPEISKAWLLTGEAPPAKDGILSTDTPAKENILNEDYRLVPLINIDAVGGMYSANEIMNEPEYILGTVAFNGALEGDKCIQVTGHSMEPACPPGSIVLIRQVERWKEYFGFGNIFVILLDDGRRVLKQITKSDDDPKNCVKCVSFNREYPEEDLPKSMIAGVWKVIKVLTNRGW